MKRIAAVLFLSLAVSLGLGWMLAMPSREINPRGSQTLRADGGPPIPPPPNRIIKGVRLADDGPPVLPPPNAV